MSLELDQQLRKLEALILASSGGTGMAFWHGYDTTLMIGLRALLDSRQSPTWMKALDGTVLYVNPAFCSRFSIEPSNYLGRKEESLWDNPCASSWAANDLKVVRSGIEEVFAEMLPSGQIIQCRKWPVRIDGQTIGVAGEMICGSGPAQ